MNRMKTLACVAAAAIPVSIAGVAIAGASDAPEGQAPNPAPAVALAPAKPLDASVAAHFSVFRRGSARASTTAPQTLAAGSPLAIIQRSLAGTDAGSSMRQLDLSRAVEVPIDGAAGAHAWIAPAGDHVCTIIPDPVDGAGVSCSSIEQAERGRAVGLLGGDGTVLATTIVPDGGETPTVKTGTDERELPVRSNLSAVKLPGEGIYLPDGHSGSIDLAAVAALPRAASK